MSDRTFKEIFRGKQSLLEEKLDIDHGLLTKLVDYRVITESHKQNIKVISVTVNVF